MSNRDDDRSIIGMCDSSSRTGMGVEGSDSLPDRDSLTSDGSGRPCIHSSQWVDTCDVLFESSVAVDWTCSWAMLMYCTS